MKIDRRSIDRLASLDDESFKSLAMSIASAAGADTRKAQALLSDTALIKRRLASMTPEDAEKLISGAGEEKSEEILRVLRERGVDIG